MMVPHRRLVQPYGFTLVELLVAITFVALLLSTVLPALDQAQENAKAAVCRNQVRGIAQASMIYAAADPEENGIPVGPSHSLAEVSSSTSVTRFGNYGFGGKSGVGKANSPTGVDTRRPTYGRLTLMASWHRPLNATMYKRGISELPPPLLGADPDTERDLDLFKCPGDTGFKGLHYSDQWGRSESSRAKSSYDYFGTSYAANVFWTGSGASQFLSTNSPYLRPLSRVPAPSNTILYMENVGRYAWRHNDPASAVFGESCDFLPCPPYPDDLGGPEWHQSGWRFQTAFADGHADAIYMQSYVPVDPYPTNLVGDCANVGACRWIMVRDRGWQLDTLPAVPVETRVRRNTAGGPSADGSGLCGHPTNCQ